MTEIQEEREYAPTYGRSGDDLHGVQAGSRVGPRELLRLQAAP